MAQKLSRERWLLIFAGMWVFDYALALALLQLAALPDWARTLIAFLPIPTFALFLAVYLWALRGMDELQRRMHLEALAVAFPLAVIALMTFGLLERVIPGALGVLDIQNIWVALPIAYAIGLLLSWRRYR